MSEWTNWETQLHTAVEHLLALKLVVNRYDEWANIVVGLMMITGRIEIEIPGQGKVTLRDNTLSVTVEPVAFLRPFI